MPAADHRNDTALPLRRFLRALRSVERGTLADSIDLPDAPS